MTAQPPAPIAPPLSCLVVEDEPDLLEALVEWFDIRGWAVTTAIDLASARKVLDPEGACFDLVITDDALPDGRGLDLIRFALARPAPRPFLLLVSGSMAYGGAAVAGKVADAYLPKPFTFQQLAAAIAHIEAAK